MRKQDLLGRWALRQWTQAYDDGRVTLPMGQAPGASSNMTTTACSA